LQRYEYKVIMPKKKYTFIDLFAGANGIKYNKYKN